MDSPTTVWGSPSTLWMKAPPKPSIVNEPAQCSGSPGGDVGVDFGLRHLREVHLGGGDGSQRRAGAGNACRPGRRPCRGSRPASGRCAAPLCCRSSGASVPGRRRRCTACRAPRRRTRRPNRSRSPGRPPPRAARRRPRPWRGPAAARCRAGRSRRSGPGPRPRPRPRPGSRGRCRRRSAAWCGRGTGRQE